MTVAAIGNQIKSILEGVSGIGIVHVYERWSANWDTFLEHFKTGGKINGWTISRSDTSAKAMFLRTTRRAHTIKIRGVYGLRDADGSETVFQALIEAIQNACDTAYYNNTVNAEGLLQVKAVEPRMFGSVLCHYAELEWKVNEDTTC